MRQPGIEVRPIRMISGESEFNEVFYTDAVAPKGEVIGGLNNVFDKQYELVRYYGTSGLNALVGLRYQPK